MFRPLFAAGYAEITAENCKGSAVASAAITYLITHPFFRGVARSVQAAGRITPARFVCAKPNVLLSEKRYAYCTFIALLGPVWLAQTGFGAVHPAGCEAGQRAQAVDFYRHVGALGRVFVDIETQAFALPA